MADTAKTYVCMNRFINVKLFYNNGSADKAIVIDCPLTGVKPDITVELAELPAMVSLGMTVTIKNMNIDIDVTKCYAMRVEMGYATYGKAIYDSAIFYTSRVSPNPDGIIVFKSVVTGYNVGNITYNSVHQYYDMFKYDPAEVNIIAGMTLAEILKAVLADKKYAMPFDISYVGNNAKKFSTEVIKNSIHVTFKNAAERVSFAVRLINRLTKPSQSAMYEQGYMGITPVVTGNILYIFDSTENAEAVAKQVEVVNITGYNSASYDGALLTLNMPYLPTVHPGMIVKGNIGYYQKAGTPSLSMQSNILQKNTFWVIRMSVRFSTIEDNSMEIVAKPGDIVTADSVKTPPATTVVEPVEDKPVPVNNIQKTELTTLLEKAASFKCLTRNYKENYAGPAKQSLFTFLQETWVYNDTVDGAWYIIYPNEHRVKLSAGVFYPLVVLATYLAAKKDTSNTYAKISDLYKPSLTTSAGIVVMPSPDTFNTFKSEIKQIYTVFKNNIESDSSMRTMMDNILQMCDEPGAVIMRIRR